MYMFPKEDVSFDIRSSAELWGFLIEAVDRNGKVLETYYLHQSYNMADDSPDSSWKLKLDGAHPYDEPLLTGRLVCGRTDPFSPLMKCLQFLNKKWGQ